MSENKTTESNTPETETIPTPDPSAPEFDWTLFWKRRSEETSAKASALAEKIIASMLTVGIPEVVVSYNGAGDSGQVDYITVPKQPGASDEEQATEATLKTIAFHDRTRTFSGFDNVKGEWVTNTRPATLHDLIEDLAYLVIDIKHPGWENNDGASGDLTINAKEGTIVLDHNEYITSSEAYSHTLKFEGNSLKEIDDV